MSKQNAKVLLQVSAMVIFTRVFIYTLGYMGIMLFQNSEPGFFPSFNEIWSKWDADHYLSIAANWYNNVNEDKVFLVFFPLYPIMIKIFALITHSYFWGALLISNLSLILACFYLYKLAELELKKRIAVNAVKYLLIFPVTFFLSAPFSDSLFIALSAMTLYYARIRKWHLAGITGMLAAFTRSFGILLVIPFIIEFIATNEILQKLRGRQYRQIVCDLYNNALYIFMIPFGFFSYLLLNKTVSGDWFKFLEYQKEHWHNSFGFFANNIIELFKNSFVNSRTSSEKASLFIPQLIMIGLFIPLLFYSIKKLRFSYSAYMIAYIFIVVSPAWLLSGPRYLMGMIPVYLSLAMLSRHKLWDAALTFFSIMWLSYCTLAYVTGYFIM